MKDSLYNTLVKFINRPFCVECNSYLSPTGDDFESYECQCTLRRPHRKSQVPKAKANKFMTQRQCTCDMDQALAASSANDDEEPKIQKLVKTSINLIHTVQMVATVEEIHRKLFGFQENSKTPGLLEIPSTPRMVTADEIMAVVKTMRKERKVSVLDKRSFIDLTD